MFRFLAYDVLVMKLILDFIPFTLACQLVIPVCDILCCHISAFCFDNTKMSRRRDNPVSVAFGSMEKKDRNSSDHQQILPRPERVPLRLPYQYPGGLLRQHDLYLPLVFIKNICNGNFPVWMRHLAAYIG